MSMENKEATRTCGQCHKEVAEANFALHETHCSRFLCLCPDCGESVPREQLSQHREEQHTQVRCSKCNKKMQRCHLEDHQSDECVERLQSCQYCDLELPWKELDEHSLVCGSRTERCRDCGRYVTLRDLPSHGLTCSDADSNGSGPPNSNSKPPASNTKLTATCRSCQASFPVEDLDEHELWCVPATGFDDEEDELPSEEREDEDVEEGGLEDIPSLNSAYKAAAAASGRPTMVPWDNGWDPNQITTCPHCHLALPLTTLRWHERKCQIHILLK